MLEKISLTKNIRHQRILTDDDLLELEVMYRSGKFYVKEIADWFGINVSAVNYWIDKLGLKGKGFKWHIKLCQRNKSKGDIKCLRTLSKN